MEERRKRQRAQRRLSFKRQPDGMFELFGRFDPLTGSRIEAAITAAANKLWHTLVHTNAADIVQGSDGDFHRRHRRAPTQTGLNGSQRVPVSNSPSGNGADIALPLRC